jgi:hypothetical protein
MTDYTHKKYLVKNTRTGATRVITRKVGAPSALKPNEVITCCLGGFRATREEA